MDVPVWIRSLITQTVCRRLNLHHGAYIMTQYELHRIVNRDVYFATPTGEQYQNDAETLLLKTDISKLRQQFLSKASQAPKSSKPNDTEILIEAQSIVRRINTIHPPTALELLLATAIIAAFTNNVNKADSGEVAESMATTAGND
jgi:hypothetical protein